MEPKAGDTIRIVRDDNWYGIEVLTFTLEVFRHTLGYFADEQAREASRFTALSDPDLYGNGPESKDAYISNYGPYKTNQIPLYEIISKPE
ncbi:hypothetical protein [Erwinia sp. E_sp_B04_7]|uniref:hypothetical protein n=1 Tax=unclassified Erwinia TaxID=2622719 RepID=UPI0030CB2C31